MRLADLALAATQASAEVALVCVAGALLARHGVFTQQVQRAMAKANMFLFTPCLLFVKIAATVTAEKFLQLWPVPLAFLIFCSLSWLMAVIGSTLFRLSEPQRRLAIVSMMFSNSNSLPIALMQSISLSKSVSVLFWGENDTVDNVVARGMTYIMFFGLAGNFVRWSYGFELIGKGDGSESQGRVNRIQRSSPEPSALTALCGICRRTAPEASSGGGNDWPSEEAAEAESSVGVIADDNGPCSPETPLLANSLARCRCPGGPVQLKPNLARCCLLALLRVGKSFKNFVQGFFKAMMTAPILTTLVALFVGLVPPLRNLMFGPDAPLRPSLTAAIDQCGNASVPLILLSLGAQLATLPSATERTKSIFADAEAPSDHTEESTEPRCRTTDCEGVKPASVSPPSKPQDGCALISHVTSTSTLVPQALASSPCSSRSSSSVSCRPRRMMKLTQLPNYRTITLVLLGRLVVSPLIAAPVVFAARPFMGALADDPVFLLVLVLLGSSPTAINLIQICQVHGYFEADMARLLFVSYIGAVPIMTAVVTVAMAVLNNLKAGGSL